MSIGRPSGPAVLPAFMALTASEISSVVISPSKESLVPSGI